MNGRRWGSGLQRAAAVLLLIGGLIRCTVASAQDSQAKRKPAPPPSAGSMGILPAGGMTGGGGGASAGTGASGAAGCSGFMQCMDASQGTGAMISFEISLASPLTSMKIDQLKISLAIGGKPVSWSPRIFPEDGIPVLFPMTTPFMQTCADEYGEAISTVEAFVAGKLVGRAAGTVSTENCAAVIPNVILQPVAQSSGAAGAGAAGSAGSAGSAGADSGSAGTGSTRAGTGSPGASAAGRSAAGSSSAAAGRAGLDDSSSEDDGSCSCSTLGVARSTSGLTHAGLMLALAAVIARAGRSRRR